MPRKSPEPAAEPAGMPYDQLAWEARVAAARARRAASLASRSTVQDPQPGLSEAGAEPWEATAHPPAAPEAPPAPARRKPIGTGLLVLAAVFVGGLGIGLGAALVMTGPIQLRQETLAEVAPAAQPVAALLPEAAPPAPVPEPRPQPQPAATLPPDPAPEPVPEPTATAPAEPAAEPALAAAPEPAPGSAPASVAEAVPPADAPDEPPTEPLAAADASAPDPETATAAAGIAFASDPDAVVDPAAPIADAAAAATETFAFVPAVAPRPRPSAAAFEAAAGTAADALLGPDGAPLIGPPPPPGLLGPVATVRIHAPVNLSRAEVDRAIAALRAQGHRIDGPYRVSFSISRSNARYFHGADAEAARAVGGALGPSARGTTVETRDFTHFSPRPPAGTVELWLAGRGAAQQSAPVAADRRPSNPIEALGREIARIFNPNR